MTVLEVIDIVTLKKEIESGKLQLRFKKENILIEDTTSGEVVKIGEIPKYYDEVEAHTCGGGGGLCLNGKVVQRWK